MRQMRPFLPSGEATCATRSYSRIMRGPDCFERSCPCPQAGVEPGRRGGREVEGPAWMLGEPLANLWMRMDQMPARDRAAAIHLQIISSQTYLQSACSEPP